MLRALRFYPGGRAFLLIPRKRHGTDLTSTGHQIETLATSAWQARRWVRRAVVVEEDLVGLAIALAAAVQARLPQLDLGGLPVSLLHVLRQKRRGGAEDGRSAATMAVVAACPPARQVLEERLPSELAIRLPARPPGADPDASVERLSTTAKLPRMNSVSFRHAPARRVSANRVRRGGRPATSL